jgi:hypothetical protein
LLNGALYLVSIHALRVEGDFRFKRLSGQPLESGGGLAGHFPDALLSGFVLCFLLGLVSVDKKLSHSHFAS